MPCLFTRSGKPLEVPASAPVTVPQANPRLAGHRLEKLAIAPALAPHHRRACADAGYLPLDLGDLTAGFL